MSKTSPLHVYDGESPKNDLSATPIQLESKLIPSDQWLIIDYAEKETDGFDGFDKVWNNSTEQIGRCMVVYSELEAAIEDGLHELINERSDQMGMIITRKLSYHQKVQIYIDLLRAFPGGTPSRDADIKRLKSHLERAAELRNIIAHAKWPSITEEGFVFSSVEAISADREGPQMKYYRLDQEAMERIFDYISAVGNMPFYINEEYPLLLN